MRRLLALLILATVSFGPALATARTSTRSSRHLRLARARRSKLRVVRFNRRTPNCSSSERIARLRALLEAAKIGSAPTAQIRETIAQLGRVPVAALPDLYRGLHQAGLALGGAGTFGDVTSCPGADTCAIDCRP